MFYALSCDVMLYGYVCQSDVIKKTAFCACAARLVYCDVLFAVVQVLVCC